MTANERVPRSERLYVRLTVEEAKYVASRADAMGLTVSDFVRDVVLRRGVRGLTGRRMLSTDAAGTIRQLSAIATDLRRLVVVAETSGMLHDKLDTCLDQVQVAIGGFEP